MKLALFLLGLTLVAFPPAASLSTVQDENIGIRGAYIGGRTKRPGRRPKRQPRPPKRTDAEPAAHEAAAEKPDPVSLGVTLFRIDSNGESVRVNPSQTFREGDKLRLQLEPGIDGHIYVFYTENGLNPTMIFPDHRIEDGKNSFTAHRLAEVPSRENPRFDCFKLTGSPAVEKLYVFVSREPLAGVPIGQELVRLCSTSPTVCPWRPSDSSWTALLDSARGRVETDTRVEEGGRQTENEVLATTRGITLGSSDEEPTLISACADPAASVLVHTIEIVHR